MAGDRAECPCTWFDDYDDDAPEVCVCGHTRNQHDATGCRAAKGGA